MGGEIMKIRKKILNRLINNNNIRIEDYNEYKKRIEKSSGLVEVVKRTSVNKCVGETIN